MIKPDFLKKGDKAIIVSPAGVISNEKIEAGVDILKSWGLKVAVGKNALAKNNVFAGTDKQRLQDFQNALDDDNIKLILCSRGGYGTNRIIEKLDFTKFIKNPKWIVGYSDITILHSHINKNYKVETIHGLMATNMLDIDEDDVYLNSLYYNLFGRKIEYQIPSNKFNKLGKAKAEIVGGNLAILTSLIGTKSDINTKGKILIIEDVGEYLYKIDRMIISLKQTGKLEYLKGLVVGSFSSIKDSDPSFGKNVTEIILEHTAEYNYPVCFDFPFGHEPKNYAIVLGRKTELNISKSNVNLKQY